MDERAAVRRLLQRVGFGPRPGELERATAAGFTATLSALLDAPGPDEAGGAPPPVLRPLPAGADGGRDAGQLMRGQIDDLRQWWLARMVATEHPLVERLTFFWHGVFATSVHKVRSAALMLAQNQTLRRLGGGELRPLVAAMAVDPAMLIWLDGQRNQRGRPNENLARELMEQFTIGQERYTEGDVKQAARALTGWRVDRATGTAHFDPQRHDDAALTVLGHTARMDVDELVGLLVAHPQCRRFLAGRMWRRFVSDVPPSPQRLDELAAAAGTGRELLRAVLTSPEFRAPESALVRQPVEWLAAAHRALGTMPVRPPGGRGGRHDLGQELFAPPSVAGWPAGAAWLTTATIRARMAVAELAVNASELRPIRDVPPGDRVRAAGELLSLDWTPRTAAALDAVAMQPRTLLTLALISPENLVSA